MIHNILKSHLRLLLAVSVLNTASQDMVHTLKVAQQWRSRSSTVQFLSCLSLPFLRKIVGSDLFLTVVLVAGLCSLLMASYAIVRLCVHDNAGQDSTRTYSACIASDLDIMIADVVPMSLFEEAHDQLGFVMIIAEVNGSGQKISILFVDIWRLNWCQTVPLLLLKISSSRC